MSIMALDMGRVSAFAFAELGRRPVWGHATLAEPQANGRAVLGEAWKWINTLIAYHQPQALAQEKPYVPNPNWKTSKPFKPETNERLQRLAGLVELAAFEHKLLYFEPRIVDVAGHFLGAEGRRMRSDKKKRQTIVICKLHGWSPVTSDEADALALLSYMEWSLSPGQARLRGEGVPLFLAAAHQR